MAQTIRMRISEDRQNEAELLAISASSTVNVGIGSLLYNNSGAVYAVASGTNYIKWYLTEICDSNGDPKDLQYLAASAAGYCKAIQIKATDEFDIIEDGVETAISTSIPIWADLVVGTVDVTSATDSFCEVALANIKVDSSSASATQGTLQVQILGKIGDPSNTASPYWWRCRISSGGVAGTTGVLQE